MIKVILILIIVQLCYSQSLHEHNAKFKCGIKRVSIELGRLPVPFPKTWPWTVAVEYQKFEYPKILSGTILSEFYILTHKSTNETDYLYVIPGLNDLSINIRRNKVARIINHPDPNVKLSLLELDEPLQFSEYVSPICIPESQQVDVIFNQPLALTGW